MNWWIIIIGILLVFGGVGITFLQIGEREKRNVEYYQKDPFYDDGFSTQRKMPPKQVSMTTFLGRVVSWIGVIVLLFGLLAGSIT